MNLSEQRKGIGTMAAVAVIAAVALIAGGGIFLAVYDSDGTEEYYEYSFEGTLNTMSAEGEARFTIIEENEDGSMVLMVSVSIDVWSDSGLEAGFYVDSFKLNYDGEFELGLPLDRTEDVGTAFGMIEADVYKVGFEGAVGEVYMNDGVIYKATAEVNFGGYIASGLIELVGSNAV